MSSLAYIIIMGIALLMQIYINGQKSGLIRGYQELLDISHKDRDVLLQHCLGVALERALEKEDYERAVELKKSLDDLEKAKKEEDGNNKKGDSKKKRRIFFWQNI